MLFFKFQGFINLNVVTAVRLVYTRLFLVFLVHQYIICPMFTCVNASYRIIKKAAYDLDDKKDMDTWINKLTEML